MKEHYVTYEQAVKLKELGFDEKVNTFYTNDYVSDDAEDITREVRFHRDFLYNHNIVVGCWSAPRLDQAQAWLREVKGIDIEVITILNLAQKTKSYKANLCYFGKNEFGEDCANYKIACLNIHSYEKALELGIDKALELLTNKS